MGEGGGSEVDYGVDQAEGEGPSIEVGWAFCMSASMSKVVVMWAKVMRKLGS